MLRLFGKRAKPAVGPHEQFGKALDDLERFIAAKGFKGQMSDTGLNLIYPNDAQEKISRKMVEDGFVLETTVISEDNMLFSRHDIYRFGVHKVCVFYRKED